MPRKTRQPKWLPKVEEHDFAAAESYLALIHPQTQCKTLVAALRASELVQFKAKDIFRASGLSLLGISNSHVEKDRAQIEKGEALSPLLLVRDEKSGRVVVADGYHRLCAVYQVDEDAWIPCKIV
jgi:disulfide oxidoreductase YuzD